MARFHDSGTICSANKRACPLGLSDGDHIDADSVQDFQAKLAEKMESQGESFGTTSKTTATKPKDPYADDPAVAKAQERYDSIVESLNQVEYSNALGDARMKAQRELNAARQAAKEKAEGTFYIHPQGKVIQVEPDGRVRAFKNGQEIGTSATAEKLAAGYGQWKKDDSGKAEAIIATSKPRTARPMGAKPRTSQTKTSTAPKAEVTPKLTPAEQDALVDSYDDSIRAKNQAYKNMREVVESHAAYDKQHAEAEGRLSYTKYDFSSESYSSVVMPGRNPNPNGHTKVTPTELQTKQMKEAHAAWSLASHNAKYKQTELEEAGLGHRIPDEGNTIRVRTQAQKHLLVDELQGQISDGHWSNSQNNPWQDWSNAKVIVDPKNPGRNFSTRKDNYQLNSKELLSIVGKRMQENVTSKTGKDYSEKEMAADLKDLRAIFKTQRNQVTGD